MELEGEEMTKKTKKYKCSQCIHKKECKKEKEFSIYGITSCSDFMGVTKKTKKYKWKKYGWNIKIINGRMKITKLR